MKINLVDQNTHMCAAWNRTFKTVYENDMDAINIYHGDFFDPETDAVVSPANSFGFMDGGLDYYISTTLGWHVQQRVQKEIVKNFNGELLVGQALSVLTHKSMDDDPPIKYVISAPTMRVPMILGTNTVNVYLATKAALIEAKKIGANTVTFSGMGTGVGQVPYSICAHQMRVAYDEVIGEENMFPLSWDQAQKMHRLLYGDISNKDLQKYM